MLVLDFFHFYIFSNFCPFEKCFEPLSPDGGVPGALGINLKSQKKKFSKDQLIQKLSLLKKNNQNLKIYIKGDKKLDYGKVMDLMNLINQSGFKKVALVTRLK